MKNQINLINIALDVLAIESQAIQNLIDNFPTAVEDLILTITKSNLRLVVCGVGKSGWVGRKLVSTLHSTGNRAIFLHPTEALHGDLGMLQADDLVLFISKSGESEEIKAILPTIRERGIKTATICSNPAGHLYKNVDIPIYLPVPKEADTFNWVPTTSTTLQMVMSDAIVVGLMEVRGFTKNDFAQNHPGGLIGKSLILKVKDLLQDENSPLVHPDTPIHEVLHEMSRGRLGACAVLDSTDRIIGIITDGDVRRFFEKGENINSGTAREMMTETPTVIDSEEYATEALKRIKEKHINHLIVVNEELQFAGILHIQRLLEQGFN